MTETAQKIEDALKENNEATISDLAEQLDLPEEEIFQTLDEHHVQEDGTIVHVGEGQGGGWAPARAAEASDRRTDR